MNNLDLLIPTEPTPPDNWQWATVTQASPLRVRLDGDATPLLITPECLFYGPVVGQRVWVQMYNRRVIVHAPSGGVTPYVPRINVVSRSWAQTGQNNSAVPNGVTYTVYGGDSPLFAIPTGAQVAQIQWTCNGKSDSNAAGFWSMYVKRQTSGWMQIAEARVHNESDAGSNLSASMAASVDIDELEGNSNIVACVNLSADSGGGWIALKPGAVNVSFLAVS